MTLRLVGLSLTSLAVLVLLTSLVLGLRGQAIEGGWETVSVNRLTGAERIRVEVLNGAGISGLARDVTERLRARGFDVVYYGNATGGLARDSTVVLDRGSDPEGAALVAEELGIARVELLADTTLYLEATVILGPDWEEIAQGSQ